MTSGELASRLTLPLRGDASVALEGAAPLKEAAAGQLAYVASPKLFAEAQKSHAACLIGPPDLTCAAPLILSVNPRADFARALTLLYPSALLPAGIHPTAVVSPESRIGEDARIGPNVTIYPGVTIGKRCTIHAGAVIGADGFGFEIVAGRWQKIPQVGKVKIGDDVEIGANTCIDRAALGVTSIGDGTKLDNMVHIGHNCRIGKHVVIAAQTGLAGGVEIGDYAVVGGQVGIGDKALIEPGAIIGSGAGILTSKIVRAGEPVWGTPARPLRQYLRQLAALSRLAKRR